MTARTINLITGIVAAIVIAVAVGWVIAVLVPECKTSGSARKYVAYFDDAGGIEAGDAVRIKGRRAGVVEKVELVIHEGRTMNRVEFVIAPGTGSKWLEDERIAPDSRIAVSVPRMFRRPQLVITPGDDAGEIPEGGEWTNTKGGDSDSEVNKIKDVIDQVSESVAKFGAFVDDPEGMQRVQDSIAELRENLSEIDQSASGVFGKAAGSDAQLESVRKSLADLAHDFKQRGDSIGDSITSLEGASGDVAKSSDKINGELKRLADSIARFEASSSESRAQLEAAGLDKLGVNLRKFAARLRSSMEVAQADPKQFGDMPNWRKSRRYFNGDHPLPGGDPDGSKGN